MKNALRNKKVWIIGIILTAIGVGLPFLILGITIWSESAAPFQYQYMLWLFFAVFLLIGFVWGDVHTVRYRRKNKNWDDEIPESTKTESWERRMPFYLASICCLIAAIVVDIIYMATGSWPLL